MTIKVFINRKAIDGILRVIEAQVEHLPKFGITVVDDIRQADVICNHGNSNEQLSGVPIVHVGHGFMWSRQPWGDGFMDVNRQVTEAMHSAVAHTAPSEWVARAIRRGGYWYPKVIYHGVDADKFTPSREHGNYVLWNKARADYVSDPGDMIRLAESMPGTQFRSTIGSQNPVYSHPSNVKIIGPKPYKEMRKIVSDASVYLATARETFGIGTLEALASGVPVAGWNWGGQSEIIIHGVTGYLAPPGDYHALQECVQLCIAERDRLSANCVQDARENWKWEPRIQQYAELFMDVYQKWNTHTPKVSVIVTAYNLDEYIPDCLDSIKEQTFKDFECIVVDDANQPSTRKIVENYARSDERIRYAPTPENLGLPGARNFGLSLSRGRYVRHVDADDFLSPSALELETNELDRNRSVDIVYGHLEVVRTDGSRVFEHGEPVRGGWPPENYNWYHQMAHLNQLPSCVMARREVYERSGGYRTRMRRNEDAEFWCRVTSLGFRAHKFTSAVTYFHRERNDSKGALEWQNAGAEPDWTAWFPWRMGASNYQQARDILRQRGESPQNSYIVPFGAQGKPPRSLGFWYVHDYANPIVSIVVTCGPGHRKYLIDALDSIQAQTYPDWEVVVVNDTGEAWEKDIMGAPWARVINMDGNKGVAAARNEGFKHTSGKYIVWMDADDYWMPWLLERMVSTAEYNTGVIFSDIILSTKEGNKVNMYKDFDSSQVIHTMQYPGSSILVPRTIASAMVEFQGGFDEQIPGMEDWDYQIGVHHLGYCAFRIPDPLFVYRMQTSTKREKDYAKIDEIVRYIDQKWSVYRKGEKTIMCGCASTRTPPSTIPASLLKSSGNFTQESIQNAIQTNDKNIMVTVEYIGERTEPFSIRSRVDPSVTYRFANNDNHRTRVVFVGDANYLLGMVDGVGEPTYRVVSNVVSIEVNDPASVMGEPLVA